VIEQSVNSLAVTTFNIFYDGLSFQHMATVLISVFTLCYGPGLLFRGPCCLITVASRLLARKQLRKCSKLVVLGDIECGITRMNGEHLGRKSGKYISKMSPPS